MSKLKDIESAFESAISKKKHNYIPEDSGEKGVPVINFTSSGTIHNTLTFQSTQLSATNNPIEYWLTKSPTLPTQGTGNANPASLTIALNSYLVGEVIYAHARNSTGFASPVGRLITAQDTTTPNPGTITVSSPTTSSLTISRTTAPSDLNGSGIATVELQYSYSGNAGTWISLAYNPTYPYVHSNRSADTLIHYRVVVTDNAGNIAISSTASGTTSAVIGVPTMTGFTVANGNNSLTTVATALTASSGTGIVEWKVSTSPTTPVNGTGSANISYYTVSPGITLSAWESDITLYAFARNSSGWSSPMSTVARAVDTIPPTAATLLAAPLGPNTISVNATTVSSDSQSGVNTRTLRRSTDNISFTDLTVNPQYPYSDAGRQPNTTYYYKETSTDYHGNSSTSNTSSATTNAAGNLLTQNFATSPLPTPWYDITSFTVDAGRYKYPWSAGQSGSPTGSSRVIISPRDILDISFDFSTTVPFTKNARILVLKDDIASTMEAINSGLSIYLEARDVNNIGKLGFYGRGRSDAGYWTKNYNTFLSTAGSYNLFDGNTHTIRLNIMMNTTPVLHVAGQTPIHDTRINLFVDGQVILSQDMTIDSGDNAFKEYIGQKFGQILISPNLSAAATQNQSLYIDNLVINDNPTPIGIPVTTFEGINTSNTLVFKPDSLSATNSPIEYWLTNSTALPTQGTGQSADYYLTTNGYNLAAYEVLQNVYAHCRNATGYATPVLLQIQADDSTNPTPAVLSSVTGTSSTTVEINISSPSTDSMSGIANRYIQRFLGGSYVDIVTDPIYPQTISTLLPGTTYCFREKAVDVAGNISYSNLWCGTTQAAAGVSIITFTGSPTTNTKQFFANTLSGTNTPLEFWLTNSSTLPPQYTGHPPSYYLANGTGYTIPSWEVDTNIYAHCRNAAGYATPVMITVAARDTISPNAAVLTATTISDTQIDINQYTAPSDAQSGISSYILERSPNGSTGWVTIATNPNFPYPDTGLIASTPYYYRNTITDFGDNIAVSSTVTATTQSVATMIGDTFSGAGALVNTSTEFGNILYTGDLDWVQSGGYALANAWNKVLILDLNQVDYDIIIKDVVINDIPTNIYKLLFWPRYTDLTSYAEIEFRNTNSGDQIRVRPYSGAASQTISLSGPNDFFTTGRSFRVTMSPTHMLSVWEVLVSDPNVSLSAKINLDLSPHFAARGGLQTATKIAFSTQSSIVGGTPGTAKFSGFEIRTTNLDWTPPSAITDLVADTIGVANPSAQVHLTFSQAIDAESGIAKYDLMNNNSVIIPNITQDFVNPFTGIISGLNPSTTYSFKIRAYNPGGLYSDSNIVAYSTTGTNNNINFFKWLGNAPAIIPDTLNTAGVVSSTPGVYINQIYSLGSAPTFDSNITHGGTHSLKLHPVGNDNGNNETGVGFHPPSIYPAPWDGMIGSPEIFYRVWMLFSPTFSWGTNGTAKSKMNRVAGDPVIDPRGYTGYFDIGKGFGIGECEDVGGASPGGSCPAQGQWIYYDLNNLIDGKWHEYIFRVKPDSAINAADAEFEVWIDNGTMFRGSSPLFSLHNIDSNHFESGSWPDWGTRWYFQMNSSVASDPNAYVYCADYSVDSEYNSNYVQSFTPEYHAVFEQGTHDTAAYEYGGGNAVSGDAWTDVPAGGTSTTYDTQNILAYTGGASCKMVSTGGTHFGGYASYYPNTTTYIQSTEGEELWFRMYHYVPSSCDLRAGPGWVKWMRLGCNTPGGYHLDCAILNGGAGFHLENAEVKANYATRFGSDSVTYRVNESNTPIPRDRWFSTEMYVKLSSNVNSPTGIMRFWMDGVLQCQLLNVQTLVANTDTVGSAAFNTNWNTLTSNPDTYVAAGQTMWADEVVFCTSDRIPPNLDSANNRMIGSWTQVPPNNFSYTGNSYMLYTDFNFSTVAAMKSAIPELHSATGLVDFVLDPAGTGKNVLRLRFTQTASNPTISNVEWKAPLQVDNSNTGGLAGIEIEWEEYRTSNYDWGAENFVRIFNVDSAVGGTTMEYDLAWPAGAGTNGFGTSALDSYTNSTIQAFCNSTGRLVGGITKNGGNPNFGTVANHKPTGFTTNAWHKFKYKIYLGSAYGVADGYIEWYIDDMNIPVKSAYDLLLRQTDGTVDTIGYAQFGGWNSSSFPIFSGENIRYIKNARIKEIVSGVGTYKILSDNFETGTLETTRARGLSGYNNQVPVTSTNPKNGLYSLEFVYTPSQRDPGSSPPNPDPYDPPNKEYRPILNNSYTELWAQWDQYTPVNYVHRVDGGSSNNKQWAFFGPNSDYSASVSPLFGMQGRAYNSNAYPPNTDSYETDTTFFLVKNGQPGSEYTNHPVGQNNTNWVSSERWITAADFGKWAKITVHMKYSTGVGTNDGILEVWKYRENGSLTKYAWAQNLDLYMPTQIGIAEFYLMGHANSGFDQTTIFHIDNVKLSEDYIDPSGSVPIYSSNFNAEVVGSAPLKWNTTASIVSNTQKYLGIGNSVKNSITNGDTGFGTWGGVLNFPRGVITKGSEIWIRVRTYWPAGFNYDSTSSGSRLKFLGVKVKSLSGQNDGHNDIYINPRTGPNAGQTAPFVFISEAVNNQAWSPFGTWDGYGNGGDSIQFDVWETYECYMYLDDLPVGAGGTGIVRLWKNGELLDENNVQTLVNSTDYLDQFLLFTYWNGGSPQTQDMYIDDLVIMTETPSGRDPFNNPFIGV